MKIQKILHIGAAPGVNGLVRVSHNKQVFVIAAQNTHQAVLQVINVLKLIDHNVFQAFLPFLFDFFVIFKNI